MKNINKCLKNNYKALLPEKCIPQTPVFTVCAQIIVYYRSDTGGDEEMGIPMDRLQ